jgi:uncharacterized phage-associated protein
MNTTDTNTISKLEQHGYSGIDADLATSLFEYGMAWKEDDKQIEFIYGIGLKEEDYNQFDRCSFALDLDVYKEFDWACFEEVHLCMGSIKEDWDALPLPQKIYDLVSYYGFENIFGSSYWEGFQIEEDN